MSIAPALKTKPIISDEKVKMLTDKIVASLFNVVTSELDQLLVYVSNMKMGLLQKVIGQAEGISQVVKQELATILTEEITKTIKEITVANSTTENVTPIAK